MEGDDLHQLLRGALTTVEAELRRDLASGVLKVLDAPFLRPVVSELHDELFEPHWSGRVEVVYTKRIAFIEPGRVAEILGGGRLAEMTSLLAVRYPRAGSLDFKLAQLVDFVLVPRLLGQDRLPDIDEAIDYWLRWCGGEASQASATVWLRGLQLDSAEAVGLGPHVRLRRIAKGDIEVAQPPELAWITSHPGSQGLPSAVLELDGLGTQHQAHIRGESLVRTLGLFRAAGVYSLMTRLRTDNPFQPAIGSGAARFTVSACGYRVRGEEARELEDFIAKIAPLVPPRAQNSPRPSPVEIALDRYEDGLLRFGRPEQRIVAAINAIEALMLEESDELAYRLSARCSVFFGAFGFDAPYLFRTLKTAYTVRSLYVHGDTKTRKSDELERSVAVARDVARLLTGGRGGP